MMLKKLQDAGYSDEEISVMLDLKKTTNLSWQSVLILLENSKDNDIFCEIINALIQQNVFKIVKDLDDFIQKVNTLDIPELS